MKYPVQHVKNDKRFTQPLEVELSKSVNRFSPIAPGNRTRALVIHGLKSLTSRVSRLGHPTLNHRHTQQELSAVCIPSVSAFSWSVRLSLTPSVDCDASNYCCMFLQSRGVNHCTLAAWDRVSRMGAVEWVMLFIFNSYNYIRHGQPTARMAIATAESAVVDPNPFGCAYSVHKHHAVLDRK